MNSHAEWQSELAQAFRSSHELQSYLGWELPELSKYPLLVPQKLAAHLKQLGPTSPLAKQFLPNERELDDDGLVDPIGDQVHAQSKQLIHRYHNRALLIPTTVCPVNCRYCFRKNELTGSEVFAQDQSMTLNYLAAHPEIEEVIFTGGDPLVLSDEKLSHWLAKLATIDHIRFIRFHSRVPVILPSRLTDDFKSVLESFAERFKFLMVVHTNHVSEWTPEAVESVKKFTPRGLTWLSQSVLLKDINDDQQELCKLFRFLASLNVRPYYLHHPDQVRGGMHFWLSLKEGRKIWATLRDRLPGWMLPEYVIDIPQGHGKVQAFNPESLDFSGTLLSRKGLPVTLSDEATRL